LITKIDIFKHDIIAAVNPTNVGDTPCAASGSNALLPVEGFSLDFVLGIRVWMSIVDKNVCMAVRIA
jgi:hypothetical protein